MRKPIYSIVLYFWFGCMVHNFCVAQSFQIQVRKTAADTDDYINWTPVRCTIQVTGASNDQTVTLTSKTDATLNATGVLQFQENIVTLNRTTFSPINELSLTLPMDGTPVEFILAGKVASSNGKDVSISVIKSDGTIVNKHPVMVRIRKNAEDLNEGEIKRFLEALAKLHDLKNNASNSNYIKYVYSHKEPFTQLHGFPSFPPWHRAFIVGLERELQMIDATVALPYWKFDEPAPKLFSQDFLGVVDETLPFSNPQRTIVQFSPANPIRGWRMPDDAGNLQVIRRIRNAATTTPTVDLDSVLRESIFADFWLPLESNYHNTAHGHISGWLGTAASPRDPLFFMLHANVDRAWGLWQQRKAIRYTSAPLNAPANHPAREAYEPIDNYPGTADPGRIHDGQYLRDSMWPWNENNGSATPSDSMDDWPSFPAGVFKMLPAFSGNSSTIPTVVDTIDYMGTRDAGKSMEFAYDTLPYKP